MSFPTMGYLSIEIEPSVTSETQQLVSLWDVKEYLGLPANQRDRDHELLAMIEGMLPQIELIVGPIIPRVFDEQYEGGGRMIVLRNRPSVGYGTNPVLNLMSVSEYRGVHEYALSIVRSPVYGSIYSVMVDPRTGTLYRRTAGGGQTPFVPGGQGVRVIYQSGQQTVPANVRQAALEIVRVNFRTTAPAGRGRMSEVDVETANDKIPFGIGRRAREMLAPARKAPSIA